MMSTDATKSGLRRRLASASVSLLLVLAMPLGVLASISPAGPAGAASSPNYVIPPSGVTRLSGPDRYGTAAAISQATFAANVPVVYIATGENYPDALTGGPAAAHDGGPILLVPQGSIPAVVAAELNRLKPGRIVVLGGPSVVSAGVMASLGGFTSGTVTRLSGPDRYGTAAAISSTVFAANAPVTYIATGLNYPDALAGGPAAAEGKGPVLLVAQNSIPAAISTELLRLKPGKIFVLGGPSVVSDTVKGLLGTYTAGAVTRLSGPDRYATAAAISAATFAPAVPVAYIATGLNYPDALAGGAAAGAEGAPVLLVATNAIPAVVAAELTRLKPHRIVILGGPSVVSAGVAALLVNYLVP